MAFDGGGEGCAGVFFGARGEAVDAAGEGEGVVGDVVDFEGLDAWVGGLGDFFLKGFYELEAAVGFAAGRVAGDED